MFHLPTCQAACTGHHGLKALKKQGIYTHSFLTRSKFSINNVIAIVNRNSSLIMFYTFSAWNIIFPMSLIILTSVAEEMNSYTPQPGGDLAPPSIFLPDDGSGNNLIAANSWTADEPSNGQLSQTSDYSIEGQGPGQLLVGETDGCQPPSNQNRRRTSRRQVCPPPSLKATGQDTRQETGQDTGQDTGQNSGIWPTKFWPDDLPVAKIPPRPGVKADLEKCDHEKYNTPVCDEGADSSPNLDSSASEWTLPNCVPCTCSPFYSPHPSLSFDSSK